MSQVLFGVGVILIALSTMVGLYGLLNGLYIVALQAFFSFCTGSAFIIIRNLVVDLEDKDDYLRNLNSSVYDLQNEVEKLKRKASE